jgi:hypothetical protein
MPMINLQQQVLLLVADEDASREVNGMQRHLQIKEALERWSESRRFRSNKSDLEGRAGEQAIQKKMQNQHISALQLSHTGMK